MNRSSLNLKRGGALSAALAVGMVLVAAGCPNDFQTQYDLGYLAGFAQDDWYWQGYYDGYDTVDDDPVYYQGDTIPFYETPSYDAGYWDGVWVAYNDGYFVDYYYAFIVGFSEGYDNAFWPDYLDFLKSDKHSEFLNGGWGDGYNDGFSEGRIFGAADYEADFAFDWEAALTEYEDGVDPYFEEIDLGTGEHGPVELYEYGTSPFALKGLVEAKRKTTVTRTIRGGLSLKQTGDDELFRPLTGEVEQELSQTPDTTPRSGRALRLSTTWLNRIDEHLSAPGAASKRAHTRRVVE